MHMPFDYFIQNSKLVSQSKQKLYVLKIIYNYKIKNN